MLLLMLIHIYESNKVPSFIVHKYLFFLLKNNTTGERILLSIKYLYRIWWVDAVLTKRLSRYPLPCVVVGRVAVDQAVQKRGIGKVLLAHALKQQVSKGCSNYWRKFCCDTWYMQKIKKPWSFIRVLILSH